MNNLKAYASATLNMIKFYIAMGILLLVWLVVAVTITAVVCGVIYGFCKFALIINQWLDINSIVYSVLSFFAGCLLVKTVYTIHKDAQLIKKRSQQDGQ